MSDLVATPTGQTRHGVQEWCLPDGRLFEVDFAEQDLSPLILTRAAEMAYHRGGQTHPICDYDIRLARQGITGEEDRVLALTARIKYLEKRLEVVPGWSESADGISCRDDTIKLQDARITELETALAEARIAALEEAAKVAEQRRAIYAKKWSEADPFGPDTLNRHEYMQHTMEAFDLLLSELKAIRDMKDRT